jgi:tRNA(Ile)-lysidine synthase
LTRSKKGNLVYALESFVKARELFEPGARIIIGVSGGPDSMALLSLLGELRSKWDLDLMVLHCHHGLRPEADEEERLVRTWAKKWGCLFFRRKLPVGDFKKESGMSLQEAARELRYRAFLEYAELKKVGRVALAHTANDQAEEVLIGLIRGAGLGGLAGIPVKRGLFIRPLLWAYRPEILDYLILKDVPFREDPSNRDLRYLRARVRHHLLPELTKYSPNILHQLNQTAGLFQKDEEFFQEKVNEIASLVISGSGDSIAISRSKLAGLPQALSSRLIQKAVLSGTGSLRHLRAVHILAVIAAAKGKRVRGQIPLPEGWSVWWDRHNLNFAPVLSHENLVKPFFYEISRPEEVVIHETREKLLFRKVKVPKETVRFLKDENPARVDFDKLVWPLVIRSMRPGDRFQPLGMAGSKKISRFFIDRKIPANLRSRIPLVLSKGKIIWAAGLAIGQAFRLESKSSLALEMEYLRKDFQ